MAEDEYLAILKSQEQTLQAFLCSVREQIRMREEYLINQVQKPIGILDSYPEMLKAQEIAEILRVSERVAYEIMEQEDFPLLRINSNKRVLKEQFHAWLLKHQRK